MNLHTFVVHFPVALLMIYSLCELVRFQKVLMWPSWFYIKAFFVIIGAGSSVVAFGFGEVAEHAEAEAAASPREEVITAR